MQYAPSEDGREFIDAIETYHQGISFIFGQLEARSARRTRCTWSLRAHSSSYKADTGECCCPDRPLHPLFITHIAGTRANWQTPGHAGFVLH